MAVVQELAIVREGISDLKSDNKNLCAQIDQIKDTLSKLESRMRERELDSVTRKDHLDVTNDISTLRNGQTKTQLYFYIIFTTVNIGSILFFKYY